MRRLLRIGLTSAMALSVLIGVAAIAMRVRGRSVSDEFTGWHGTSVDGAEGREWYWTARFDNGRVDGGRDETILTFATPQDAGAAVEAARGVELPRWRSFPPLVPASGPSSVLNRLGFSANFSTVRARGRPGSLPVAGRRIQLLARVERQHTASAPLWAVAVVALAPPSLWLISTWHRRRRQRLRALHGRCPACGYNLRGNNSAACPECGSTVPVTPSP